MELDEAAMIRAVVADPDSDRPRLDYAAWLDRQGRPDRARLIRVQCQIEQLHGEEAGLLGQHQQEWGRELSAHGASWWRFHRGFPEEIGMPLGDFLETHRELNAVTPLRTLHLAGGKDSLLARLAELPAIAQIRALEIDQPSKSGHLAGAYGVAGVRALATSRHVADLERLDLHSHQIKKAGAFELARSPALGNLKHLALTAPGFDRMGPDFLLTMATAPGLKQVQHLQLGEQVHGPYVLKQLRRDNGPHEVAP